MPTTPYAKALVRIAGGAQQSGGITVSESQSVALEGENTSGWRVAVWQIIGPPGWSAPAGWTDVDGVATYSGTTENPPSWTLPTTAEWGKWAVTLTVNGGEKDGDAAHPEMVDTTLILSMLSSSGLVDLAVGESSQFDAVRGWSASLQSALRVLEDAVSGGGSSGAPTYVPLASGRVDASTPPTWETYKSPVAAYSFADAATNAIHLSMLAPSTAATGVIPQLHWAPNSGVAGVVRWQLDYTVANPDGTFASAGTLTVDESTPAVADKKKLTQFTSLSGVLPNAVIAMRIARIGAAAQDTYTNKVWGLGVGLGAGSYTSPPIISPQYNEIDFTPQAGSYTGITITRSGATAYVQVSTSVVETKTGNTALWEDRGDGTGGGVWFAGSYTNEVVDPFDFNGAHWTKYQSATVTTNVGDGPLAASGDADRLTDAAGAFERVLYKGGFAAEPPHRFISVWAKTAGANVGHLGCAYPSSALNSAKQREGAANIPASATWKRISISDHGYAAGNVYIGAAGYSGGNAADGTTAIHAVDVNATGDLDLWGFQLQTGQADLPLMAVGSSSGNIVGQLTTPGNMVDSGDLDVEIEWIAENFFYLDRNQTTEPVVPDGHLWSATSTDGEMSLRYSHGTGGSDQKFTLKVRGVDIVNTSTVGGNTITQGWRKGDVLKVRAWYRISTGQAGIRYSVNGVHQNNGAGTVDITAATTGGALAEATVAHIGSLSGSSSFWPMRVRKFRTYLLGSPPATLAPDFVWIGDSTSASYYREGTTAGRAFKPTDAIAPKSVMSLATSGETIQAQEARFTAIADKSAIKGVVIYVGFNNLNGSGESSATVLGRLQTLVNTVAAACPTAKIVIGKLHPCKAWFSGSASKQTAWTDTNIGIGGGGPTPITGVHAVFSGHVALMDDGAGNLASAYALDTVHENQYGRKIIGGYARAALVSAGVLS